MKSLISLRTMNLYLAKAFMLRFLQVLGVFCLIIFFINFIEALDKTSGQDVSILVTAIMAFLQIPDFLNDIIPSIILFSGIITFFFLSMKSEVTIIRGCGYSLWHIVSPVALSAFFLGVFWVVIFSPLSIKMAQQFNALERKYVKQELREMIASESGIWLKQNNLEKEGEEIVIQAKAVYKENVELEQTSIWFFNKNGQFYKKIYCQSMILKDGYWLLKNPIINDDKSINQQVEESRVPTDLKAEFILKKVVSNFQNVKLYSIFSLPSLISSLKSAGFHSEKFQVYFNNLILTPILFVAMILVSCFFGINNFRFGNSATMVFLGMIFGLALYISLNFIAALGASRFIPVFSATWVITLICLAIGVLLVYQKENL